MMNTRKAPAVAGGSKFTNVPVSSAEEIRKAIENAKDGDILKLSAPIKIEDGDSSIIIDKDITFDLNGQAITTGQLTGGEARDVVFAVKRGGTLTLNGSGSVDGSGNTGNVSAIKLTVKGEDASGTPAKLVVNSGDYNGQYYSIAGNGGRGDTDVTINGGTFNGATVGDSAALFHPESGKLTINGGTFVASDCVVVKSGNVVINGGTFSANGPVVEFAHNRNGWNCTGDCLVVEACDYPGDIPTIEVNGGTFSSVNGKPVASYTQAGYEAKRLVKFVKGGKFNKELDADLIADGYKQVEGADGFWTVMKA